MPHWKTKPPAPWPDIPHSLISLILCRLVLVPPILLVPNTTLRSDKYSFDKSLVCLTWLGFKFPNFWTGKPTFPEFGHRLRSPTNNHNATHLHELGVHLEVWHRFVFFERFSTSLFDANKQMLDSSRNDANLLWADGEVKAGAHCVGLSWARLWTERERGENALVTE